MVLAEIVGVAEVIDAELLSGGVVVPAV